MAWLAGLACVTGAIGAACAGDPRAAPRTDAAPLEARVELPAPVRQVRWRSTTLPSHADDGRLSVPGPTDEITLWAYVELATPITATGPAAALDVPAAMLDVLPAAARRTPVTGPQIVLRPRRPGITVDAVAVGAGMMVRVTVDRNVP